MRSSAEPDRTALLYCLALAIVLTLACGWLLQHMLVQLEARSWPTMKTSVKSVALRADYSRPPTFEVTIVHEFSTHAGTVQSADVVDRTTSEAAARALAARFHRGMAVDIHFRPDDPATCSFAAGAGSISWTFPSSLAGVTILMWWSFFGQLRGFRRARSVALTDTFQPPADVERRWS